MSRMPTKEGLLKWVDDYADEHDLDAREALILTKFAAYADAAMEAWALVQTLARQGRSSERKVQYVLRDFETAGIIKRTGRMHRIPGTQRDVPIYAFCGYLDTLVARQETGARRAPVKADGCTDGGVTGAQGVHPHNELIEQTPSDEGVARAREALFERLEKAYPKYGLSFTNRAQALAEFCALLDQGIDVELLIRAAAGWAEHPKGKKADVGLQYWLKDGRYRGTWPEQQLALDVENVAKPADHPGAAGAVDQTFWDTALKALKLNSLESEYGACMSRTFLGEHAGQLFAVASTTWAKDKLFGHRRKVEAAWADADPRGRPIKIVSKSEFEALRQRQVERVS